MRVKFGNRILLCTVVTHTMGSKLLIITTPNGVYTIDMITEEQAKMAHNHLLVYGFYDASFYEYSN